MLHDNSSLQVTGLTPLLAAVASRNEDTVNKLLANGANINQATKDGWCPLYMAVHVDNESMVVILLQKGADINQADNDGSSPLHRAASLGHEAMVAMLVDRGADVNQVDLDGDRPIDVAKTQKIKDMLVALTEEKQESQAVPKAVDEAQWFRAAKKGKLALIQQGINDKIDVNCRDSGGRTALYFGCQEGKPLLVEYLIAQNADVNLSTVCANVVFLSTCAPTSICSNPTDTYLPHSHTYPDHPTLFNVFCDMFTL